MIEICRDHAANVKRWQDGQMALRWVAAGLARPAGSSAVNADMDPDRRGNERAPIRGNRSRMTHSGSFVTLLD